MKRDLGRRLEAEPAVFRWPSIDPRVLLRAGDEQQLVQAGHVRAVRVKPVPLQSRVADPSESILLNLSRLSLKKNYYFLKDIFLH